MAAAGEGGAAVQGGESEVGQDVGHHGEHPGVGEADVEDGVLVDEVGEAVGAGLLMHFKAGLVAFGDGDLAEATADYV